MSKQALGYFFASINFICSKMTSSLSINSTKPFSFRNISFQLRNKPESKLAALALKGAERLSKKSGLLDNQNNGKGADFLRFLKSVSNRQDTFWSAFHKEYNTYIN
ncbi:MAG: hypothetical protein SFU25_03445 [Candidatus Caenarcaniphilales bacterium]|nr:hypothetical protein [Candidatus Caenarcaniphilales bacterium]